MNEFTKDRNGSVVDRLLIERVIKTYVQLGLIESKPIKTDAGFLWEGVRNLAYYTDNFETPFIARTISEFEDKVRVRIDDLTVYDYLKWVEGCFLLEELYCDTLLQPETRTKLLSAVENELIRKHNIKIVEKNTGVRFMLENGHTD